jgi:hypothetical protein
VPIPDELGRASAKKFAGWKRTFVKDSGELIIKCMAVARDHHSSWVSFFGLFVLDSPEFDGQTNAEFSRSKGEKVQNQPRREPEFVRKL